MKEIKLTNGQVSIVDDRDFAYLNQWRWYAGKSKQGNYYAQRSSVNKNNKSGRSIILMHRVISCAKKGQIIDHQNHNTLDNTRLNIKVGTHQDNQRNQRLFSTNKSGHAGVCFYKSRNKWRSNIGVDGKDDFLGFFEKKEDAINARKQAEVKYGFHKNNGKVMV